jgi:hypothetical protein
VASVGDRREGREAVSDNAIHRPWSEYVRWKEDLTADYEQALRTVSAVPKIMGGPRRSRRAPQPRPHRASLRAAGVPAAGLMAARTLTVWQTDLAFDQRFRRSQVCAIVATASKARAAELLGLSRHSFDVYAGDTRNEMDVKQALTEPGVVFHRALDDSGDVPLYRRKSA